MNYMILIRWSNQPRKNYAPVGVDGDLGIEIPNEEIILRIYIQCNELDSSMEVSFINELPI